jgi:hypothetical protein
MWLALTLTSFVVFLGSMFALTRLGFAADGSFRRVGLAYAGVAALSAALWLVSLAKVPPPYLMEKTRRYEAPKFPLREKTR